MSARRLRESGWTASMARRIGLPGDVTLIESNMRAGVTMHVHCERGDHTVDIKIRPGDHPDHVVKRMLAAGWTIGSKPCCPEHGRKRSHKPHGEEVLREVGMLAEEGHSVRQIAAELGISKSTAHEMKIKLAGENAMASTATNGAEAPTTSLAAKSARLDALDFLRDAFDPSTGRFKPGTSDRTIAELVNLSEKAVADLRNDWLGPLREPSEIETIRGELLALEQRRQQVGRDATASLAAIAEEMGKISTRLDVLVKKNGW